MFWSRRPYRPRIKAEDRRLPTHLGTARLLLTCMLTAACVTAVCVWPPLFFAGIFVQLSGAVCSAVLSGAITALTLGFYFLVARETRRGRELAARY